MTNRKIEYRKDEFDNYYKKIELTERQSNDINPRLGKIARINQFIRKDKRALCDNLLKLNNKYFLPLSNSITKEVLLSRIDKFFSIQLNYDINKNIKQIIDIITWQFVFSNNYFHLIGILTNIKNDHRSIIFPSSRVNEKRNLEVIEYVRAYMKTIRFKSEDPEVDKVVRPKEFYSLKKIVEDIISDLLKVGSNITAYGSYTVHNLDSNYQYNDIDIYHSRAYSFLICLTQTIKFLTDENVSILSIPYIPGLLQLKYLDIPIVDCVYLDNYTLNFLSVVRINNRSFMNPLYQYLNNIRMTTEIPRLTDIYRRQEEMIGKTYRLLSYYLSSHPDIQMSRVPIEIENIYYDVIDNELVIFHLDKLNNHFSLKYERFKKLIVFFKIETMIDFISRFNIPGKFSKKFHAPINEVFFETTSSKLESFTNPSTIEITKIDTLKNELDDKLEDVYDIIENIDCLIISNFTTSAYIKLNKLHSLTIQSMLSTLTLYHYLHSYSEKKILLKFLLSVSLSPKENINEFKMIPRKKREERHYNISIEPLNVTTVIFYKEYETEFLDRDYVINNFQKLDLMS